MKLSKTQKCSYIATGLPVQKPERGFAFEYMYCVVNLLGHCFYSTLVPTRQLAEYGYIWQ